MLHVCSPIHTCKQMEHDIKFCEVKETVAIVTLNLEIVKAKYAQVHNLERIMTKETNEEAHPPTPTT